MLRYAFLPSDFHPQFLVLGERPDIAGLADALRRFAARPTPVEIPRAQPDGSDQAAALILTPRDGTSGLHRAAPASPTFEWRLDAAGAAVFAALIEDALVSPDPAGSLILEVRARGEIPVRISFGEFTDQFLVDDF